MVEKTLIDKYYIKCGDIVNDKILYACVLNQTDLKTNKNKFYIIQLIHTNLQKCDLFIRYGRIGERGTITTKEYETIQSGKIEFCRQFRKKTGNSWTCDVYNVFKQKSGKYFLTHVDISDIDVIKDFHCDEAKSSLDERLQFLIKLISNKELIRKSLISLNLDTKKLPLGKIGKSQIAKANDILRTISSSINTTSNSFSELSSQFYTLIPYSVGRRQPPIIDNVEIIGKYLDLLNELEHIVTSSAIIKNSGDNVSTINPLDKIYDELDTDIMPLDKTGKLWKIINEYVKISKCHHYDVEVVDIFSVSRHGEKEIFDECCKNINNHMLLWHGSGLSNWCSIIKNGFRMPNTLKNVVLTGWMFGQGTYFSNLFSKSFGYTRFREFDNYACLLLSNVALGKQYKITQAEPTINKDILTSKGCDSTYAIGCTTLKNKYTINKNIIVPAGDMIDSDVHSVLLHDEFIVYDVKQINQKYIVIIKHH